MTGFPEHIALYLKFDDRALNAHRVANRTKIQPGECRPLSLLFLPDVEIVHGVPRVDYGLLGLRAAGPARPETQRPTERLGPVWVVVQGDPVDSWPIGVGFERFLIDLLFAHGLPMLRALIRGLTPNAWRRLGSASQLTSFCDSRGGGPARRGPLSVAMRWSPSSPPELVAAPLDLDALAGRSVVLAEVADLVVAELAPLDLDASARLDPAPWWGYEVLSGRRSEHRSHAWPKEADTTGARET
jgi:hypothetical protein